MPSMASSLSIIMVIAVLGAFSELGGDDWEPPLAQAAITATTNRKIRTFDFIFNVLLVKDTHSGKILNMISV
jgi:hypothetical protein